MPCVVLPQVVPTACYHLTSATPRQDAVATAKLSVQINENVRGGDIFSIQSTRAPTNDNLIELVVMVEALRPASAGRITAGIPDFAYPAPGPSRPFRSWTNHC